MDDKYIIAGSTLTSIADAIRTQENTTETIPAIDFAKHIESIEPSVEEYMKITDFTDYPIPLRESNYTQEAIERCSELCNFYSRMEDII